MLKNIIYIPRLFFLATGLNKIKMTPFKTFLLSCALLAVFIAVAYFRAEWPPVVNAVNNFISYGFDRQVKIVIFYCLFGGGLYLGGLSFLTFIKEALCDDEFRDKCILLILIAIFMLVICIAIGPDGLKE